MAALPAAPPTPSNTPYLLQRDKNGWCVYSAQIWLALELKAVAYESVLVLASEAPCFIVDGGGEERESLEAMRRLEEAHPDTMPLWPPDVAAGAVDATVRAFLAALPVARISSRAGFLFCADEGFLYDPLPRHTFEATLEAIEALLGDAADGPFFCGCSVSAADVIAAPILERYAAWLPCLHEGLLPRDSTRWPRLAAWFHAMDGIPAYTCRVRGDGHSWRKVLSTAPWWPAGWPSRGGPDERGDPRGGALALTVDATVSAFGGGEVDGELWSAYASARPGVGATPAEEAGAAVARNAASILRDAEAQGVSEAAGEEGDEALRNLVDLLLAGKSDEEVDAEHQGAVRALAAYLDERLCVPRDMGAPAAAAIRRLHRQLNGESQQEGVAPARRSVNRF